MKHISSIQPRNRGPSRREFVSWSGRVAAASALAGISLPRVHAAEDNTIRLALIGCGSRGSGAVADAMQSPYGPVKLYAMADLFEKRLAASHAVLSKKFGSLVDVPEDRKFVGFDAYKKAIDLLRPGDVAMLTGYAGWRPQQLEYAVRKGVNVFMEKSFACDPPGVRRIIQAGEEAEKKNLKIAAGLMARHSPNRQELIKRIRDGQLGEVQFIRAFRMQACGTLPPRKPEDNELHWQISHFTHFLWVSGGLFAEMNIHQVDEICWIKDAWPVSAHGVGGRIANSTDCGQNLDSLSIEWTFPDGTKAFHVTRWLRKCFDDFNTYIHGTKCAALFPWTSGQRDVTRIYKDHRCAPDNVAWRAEKELC
ncbi:MAG: gfo/Idh/MocA family oxidoreductase, partial [Verrucomicrobiae bacterium]|nr:gfo/Idh/MocA family oxidoreductase [Verrucomicrobiae bacterium]